MLCSTFAVLSLCVATAFSFNIYPRGECYTGAFIISLHGCNGRGAAQGYEQNYTDPILAAIPGSYRYVLPYDGSCDDIYSYYDTVNTGVGILKSAIEDYVESCPTNKIIIVGYSEGAHVTLNTLGGNQTDGTGPLALEYGKQLAAILTMGDPSRAVGQPYNRGTNDVVGGIFQRGALSFPNLAVYVPRLLSFCDLGDIFCAPGTNGTVGVDVHGSYFASDHYVDEGVSFAIQKFYESPLLKGRHFKV